MERGSQVAKPTVLLVEDDRDIREVLAQALRSEYNVVEAPDGVAGLSEVMVGEHPVCAVVTGIAMPNKDGIELAESLPEDLPCIVLSAYLGDAAVKERVARLNPAFVFEKPVSLSELRRAISACIKGSSTATQTV